MTMLVMLRMLTMMLMSEEDGEDEDEEDEGAGHLIQTSNNPNLKVGNETT